MGILTKGILGGFQGTVGTVVGGSWKGINYIRSLPVISNTTPSPRQLEQREKFKTIISFLRPLLAIVQAGFRSTGQMTGYNAAMAYNYRHALTGSYPAFSIDYAFVVLSNGVLPNVLSPAAVAEPGGMVRFNWTDNSGTGAALATDKVMLVVYCPELNQAVFVTGPDLRSAQTATINAQAFSGKVVHTWISCESADYKGVATSAYTGQLTVS